jgi:PEP-CTERM motif
MHKPFIQVAALLAAATFNANAVAADLIGDTLSFLRAYPNLETRYGQAISDSTVVSGMDDQVTWKFAANGPAALTIDPEADHIRFSFPVRFVTEGSTTIFDGVVISGFDRAIQSVSLLDNTAGGTVLLSHGPHEIQVNLSGTFLANQSFAIGVSVVPEPASMALMALGVGLLALRLRRHAAQRAR